MDRRITGLIRGLLIVLLTSQIFSCEKDQIGGGTACFSIEQAKVFSDSTIQFQNCSEISTGSFLWDFGDGITSSEENPAHIFKGYGSHHISLKILEGNSVVDSISKNIDVLVEERFFDYDYYNVGIDVTTSNDLNSILVLGKAGPERESLDVRYFICKYSTGLAEEWIKYFGNDINFRSIESTGDDGFILSGSDESLDHDQYAVTKIDQNGNVLWSKSYPSTNGLNYFTKEVADGGYITIGDDLYQHPEGSVPLVRVSKLDENGNIIWSKMYVEPILRQSKNIVPLDDGYLFAASTRRESANIYSQDSLVLTKINLEGEILWNSVIQWKDPHSSIGVNVSYCKVVTKDDLIYVINQANNKVMIFYTDGSFYNEKYTGSHDNEFIESLENYLIVGVNSYTNYSVYLEGLLYGGDKEWSGSFGKRDECLLLGKGVSATGLKNGDFIFLANSRCDYDVSSILLMNITEDGNIN